MREVSPPPEDLHDQVGVCDVEPVPPRGDHNEDIADLMVSVVAIVQLPGSIIVSCKAVIAKESGELLHEREDLAVKERPWCVCVVDGNDTNG